MTVVIVLIVLLDVVRCDKCLQCCIFPYLLVFVLGD